MRPPPNTQASRRTQHVPIRKPHPSRRDRKPTVNVSNKMSIAPLKPVQGLRLVAHVPRELVNHLRGEAASDGMRVSRADAPL